jgi:chromosome segregation ATPase
MSSIDDKDPQRQLEAVKSRIGLLEQKIRRLKREKKAAEREAEKARKNQEIGNRHSQAHKDKDGAGAKEGWREQGKEKLQEAVRRRENAEDELDNTRAQLREMKAKRRKLEALALASRLPDVAARGYLTSFTETPERG